MSTMMESTITCPVCGATAREVMPTDACLYFYECAGCRTVLKPKAGDCCVFCSYGSVPCPPVQESRNGGCCSTPHAGAPEAAATSWPFCSLGHDAFAERTAEIDGLVARFDGRAHATDAGMELIFIAQDGLRPALDSLIDKERQCCGTLVLTVAEGQGTVALRIAAPASDRDAVQALAARVDLGRSTPTRS